MTCNCSTRMRSLAAIAILLLLAAAAFAQSEPGKAALLQINAIQQVKQGFTPAQQKMDSGLAFAVAQQNDSKATSAFAHMIGPFSKTSSGKVVVDVHGTVSASLLQQIKAVGGDVLYESPRWNSIHAAIPLQSMEAVAAHIDVKNISSRVWAHTNIGALTTQGYVAHRAKQVVEQRGIDGGGINVGVLSDSASTARIAALKATGDLPPGSHFLAGQSGAPGTDEGAAMMEIVYDMAPGSTPIFATAFISQASFADNIIALQQAG